MLKRIITTLFCLFLIIVSTPICYASGAPSGYTPATSDQDLAQSFNDYCKSRDAKFTSSSPGSTYTYVYNYIKKYAAYAGYDIDSLQEGLYKSTSEGGGVMRWYMSSQLIGMYNNLFAYLINENDLEVGDTANVNVYSGLAYTDYDGNTCLIYVCINNVPSGYSSFQNLLYDTAVTKFTSMGTPYKYTSSDIGLLFHNSEQPYFRSSSSNYNYRTLAQGSNGLVHDSAIGSDSSTFGLFGTNNTNNNVSDGNYIVCRFANYPDRLWLCSFTQRKNPDNSEIRCDLANYKVLLSNSSDNATNNLNINFVTIDNKTINNNNYEGDTIITNEGDVINNTPPGGQDPGWNVGGGQGTYEDNNGNSYTINFPDFELPDLNIDWSIQGLGNKFPFSIPFDIASLVSVLNAEPEAPRFQGTMDLGITTYEYDINLAQFDTVASACRIAELLLLVFGLIMITRSIIKG